MRPAQMPSPVRRRSRRRAARVVVALTGVVGALLGAAAARAIAPIQGPFYPVSAFEFEYALDHPRQIPVEELLDLEIGLTGQPGVLTAPRPVDRTMRMRLSALPPNVVLSASAIQHVTRYIVSVFNRRGYNGVIVTVPDIEEGTGRDLRPPGVTTLRLRIWTGRVERLTTFADGERWQGLGADERTNNEAHDWIRERSPVQPGGLRAILDVPALEDYAAQLSRHPGRRVDAELHPGDHPGTTNVNLRIAESKPWRVFAEYSNTGTSGTTKNRERFGFVDTQLTSRDDVLDIRYTTGDFSSVNAVVGSYETPFTLDQPTLRARVRGFYSHYDASEVAFDSLGFKGDEAGGDASLVWQGFQHHQLFVDLVAGAGYQDITTTGSQFVQNGNGHAGFVLPRIALEGQRDTTTSSLRFGSGLQFGYTDASKTDRQNLGNEDVPAQFTLLDWAGYYSFYLEPLIDPAGWANPENSADSTLAHEIALRFSGQYSFNRLVPQYQAVAGGLDTVRGARQAELATDNLVLGRAEYRLHLPRLFKPGATPIEVPLLGPFHTRPAQVFGLPDWDLVVSVFTDVAYGFATHELPTDTTGTLWSAGVGTELQVLRNLMVSTDVGYLLHGPRGVETGVESGEPRVNVVATLLY